VLVAVVEVGDVGVGMSERSVLVWMCVAADDRHH
jgi:hypothetical protein